MHMLSLSALGPLRSVLAIGCHADDIEIGCGGTLLTLTRSNPDSRSTGSCSRRRATGVRRRARAPGHSSTASAVARVDVHGFRDGFLPYSGGEVKERLRGSEDPRRPAARASPTRGYDLHQDHRLACELTWNTFRNHLILEYEIPKVDGDLGTPNVFVPLTEAIVEREARRSLERHFPSQAEKHWFDRGHVPRG